MPSHQELAVGYRRNGKKPACEPCRKGKLACNHGAPSCGRCLRRKTPERCVYHPAPMTKGRASSEQAQLPAPQLPAPAPQPAYASSFSQDPGQAEIQRDQAAAGIRSAATCRSTTRRSVFKDEASSLGQPKEGWKEAVFPRSAKYYGPTSFSAIFSEHQAKFHGPLLDMGEDKRKHPGNWVFGEPLLGYHRPNGPTARENRTILALLNIPPQRVCKVLLQTVAKLRDVTLDMGLMSHCNASIWTNFGDSLSEPRSPQSLTIISDVLFKNEEHPLPPSPDDAIEWLNTFTGPNIRITSASGYKRRLFCAIYCNDKTNASLNGVPPLLTRRFCDIQPCLDLPDDASLLPQETLELAASRLDANGWNTSESTYQLSTLLRARLQSSFLREEILELALGINCDVSVSRIEEIHQRCQEVYNSLPHQLHYYDVTGAPKKVTGTGLYDRAHLLLQYLQNKFLTDRIAVARGLDSGQSLLNTAPESIDIALLFWMKRDQLLSLSCNFDWIVTFYGIPPAGVICLELLKKATSQSSVEFSRSDAIQKLTLFIAFLEWIRPTDGNYALAQRLKKVIRRVLDYVLEASEKSSRTPNTEVPFDPMLASFNEMNDIDWLNTIDWTQQGSWMDLS